MTISSFKRFLVEEEKTIFFTFGRLNPATVAHGMLMDTLAEKAGGNPYRVFLSQSQDSKKNPLDYATKIKFTRKMFPRHSRAIMLNKKIINIFDVATTLFEEGFKNITMVVGSDRVNEFSVLLKKYNGVKARHGFYNFSKINVVSAGERDPDADDMSGVSASRQRKFAADNDFVGFSQGLPKKVSNADAKDLFNAVRNGMGLKESKEFRKPVSFKPVSEQREQYIKGNMFKIGDTVEIVESGDVATIMHLGSNYLVVEMNGNRLRKWITDVKLVEKTRAVKGYKFNRAQLHRLNPTLSIKHQEKHAPEYVDTDVDGDHDKWDHIVPDEVVGVPDLTKKFLAKFKGELKMTRQGNAFE